MCGNRGVKLVRQPVGTITLPSYSLSKRTMLLRIIYGRWKTSFAIFTRAWKFYKGCVPGCIQIHKLLLVSLESRSFDYMVVTLAGCPSVGRPRILRHAVESLVVPLFTPSHPQYVHFIGC